MNVGIEQRIAEIVSESLCVDLKYVQPHASLRDDLQADSLDAVELCMMLEDEFDVEIPDETVDEIKTVQDVVNAVKKQIPDGGRS
jgi:acyl carrier protein